MKFSPAPHSIHSKGKGMMVTSFWSQRFLVFSYSGDCWYVNPTDRVSALLQCSLKKHSRYVVSLRVTAMDTCTLLKGQLLRWGLTWWVVKSEGAERVHTFQQVEAKKGKCCQTTEQTSQRLTRKSAQCRQAGARELLGSLQECKSLPFWPGNLREKLTVKHS